MRKAPFENAHQDAPNACLTFYNKSHVQGQGQVNGKKHCYCILGCRVVLMGSKELILTQKKLVNV